MACRIVLTIGFSLLLSGNTVQADDHNAAPSPIAFRSADAGPRVHSKLPDAAAPAAAPAELFPIPSPGNFATSGLTPLTIKPVPREPNAAAPQSAELSQPSLRFPPSSAPALLQIPEEPNFRQGLLSDLFPDADHRATGFLDFNLYGDTRDFSVLTINTLVRLPHDIEYFQFVNFTSDFGSPSSRDDWTGFFTELHLRRPLIPGSEALGHLDWNLMWADGHPGQGVGRVGIRWRLHDTPGVVGETLRNELNLNYALTLHFAESDGSGWQMEHVYRRTFLDGLIYVGGFADHNINGSFADSAWVTETQVGIKLVRNFYAVCEYRYNSFAPSRYRSGWGFGVEYFVPFP